MEKQKKSLSADEAIKQFAAFVGASWPVVKKFLIDSQSEEVPYRDWLQGNWELLVESTLCAGQDAYLPEYGFGGGSFERLTYPEERPTHIIAISAKAGTEFSDELQNRKIPSKDFEFVELVSLTNGEFEVEEPFLHSVPPFTHAYLESKEEILKDGVRTHDFAVVPLDQLLFKLLPLPR